MATNEESHSCSVSWLTHSFLMQHLSWVQEKLSKGSERGPPGVCSRSQMRARDWKDNAYAISLVTWRADIKTLNPPKLLVHFKMGFISLSLYLSVHSCIHFIQRISSFTNRRIYNQVELSSFHWREVDCKCLKALYQSLNTHCVLLLQRHRGGIFGSLTVSH